LHRSQKYLLNKILESLPPPLIQQTVTAITLNTRQRTTPAIKCDKKKKEKKEKLKDRERMRKSRTSKHRGKSLF